jgi:hypothetical protein
MNHGLMNDYDFGYILRVNDSCRQRIPFDYGRLECNNIYLMSLLWGFVTMCKEGGYYHINIRLRLARFWLY